MSSCCDGQCSVTNASTVRPADFDNVCMSKRKLSRRQAWRVNKIQEERAKRAEQRQARAEQALGAGELGPEQNGLVVAHFGTQVAVEDEDGTVLRCHVRANVQTLVTGAAVVWCRGEPTGVIVARLPRRGELCRPDPHGALKPVAANIDQIIIVFAALPQPHANLIDRYLVASAISGSEPILLLNKTDLLEEDAELARSMEALVSPYESLGYRVLRSAIGSSGMTDLESALADRISVFVGQSGVGKSSIINRLLPEAGLRVGALSEARAKGTHTTTTAQLLHMPSGGSLIDSPGIREFGLWHMSRAEVEQGFVEFKPHLGHCRFRDCTHEHEPGCAILAAAERGNISPQRLDSYRRIVASLEGA